MRTVRQGFLHCFGPGANYLKVEVPSGATVSWHPGNQCWYVDAWQLPAWARHDADHRGIPVEEGNLSEWGKEEAGR